MGSREEEEKKVYTKENTSQKACKANKSNIGSNNSKSTTQKSPFTVSDKLKVVLCTEGQLSSEQFDRIWENCEDC